MSEKSDFEKFVTKIEEQLDSGERTYGLDADAIAAQAEAIKERGMSGDDDTSDLVFRQAEEAAKQLKQK